MREKRLQEAARKRKEEAENRKKSLGGHNSQITVKRSNDEAGKLQVEFLNKNGDARQKFEIYQSID